MCVRSLRLPLTRATGQGWPASAAAGRCPGARPGEEPTGGSSPGASGWDQGGQWGPRCRWAGNLQGRFLGVGVGVTRGTLSPSPALGSPPMSSGGGPGPAGIWNVPKTDGLLLLAKLLLNPMGFPLYSGSSPGVTDCNVRGHMSLASRCDTLFSNHHDAGKLRAPCLHPHPPSLTPSRPRVTLVLSVCLLMFFWRSVGSV